jgi:hypothetical protein
MFQDNMLVLSPKVKQSFFSDCLNLEDGTGMSSQNIGNQIPNYAVQYPRTAKVSTTLWWKPEIYFWSSFSWLELSPCVDKEKNTQEIFHVLKMIVFLSSAQRLLLNKIPEYLNLNTSLLRKHAALHHPIHHHIYSNLISLTIKYISSLTLQVANKFKQLFHHLFQIRMSILTFVNNTTLNTKLKTTFIHKKLTSSEECFDQARLQTWEPVSTHCMGCPVSVFQKRMHRSAVPPPLANRPWWCGDHAIAVE